MYKVYVITGDKETALTAEKGKNLLELLKENNIKVNSPCRGKGFCGKCKVNILEGIDSLNPMDVNEKDLLSLTEKNSGYRLSCRISIDGDLKIKIPDEEGEAQILVDGLGTLESGFEKNVEKRYIQVDAPSIDDQRSDITRIEDNLGGVFSIDRDLLGIIPHIIRDSEFKITVASSDEEIIDVEPGNRVRENYGIGIDIGTTTVVGYLMDLNTGSQLDVYSALNPQKIHGSDVISRTDYTIEEQDGLEELSFLIREEINSMIAGFVKNNNMSSDDIYRVCIVGNTIMTHLLLRLPVKYIAVSPFVPVVARNYYIKAKDLGININPRGVIHCLPGVAGYIGSDTVAAVLSCDMAEMDETSLLIDIGTNGEMALGNREGILCCSTAAGPAFEGVHIRNGMGGVKGAINTVNLDNDYLYTTIGGEDAAGICGSGIVDGVSELLRTGLLEPYGRLKNGDEIKGTKYCGLKDRIMDYNGKPAFVIAENNDEKIIICQKDIREVQLAKGAVAAGIEILLKEAGMGYEQVNSVYLSGGFGNYINYNSAANIGLIPKQLIDRIVPIGNGAGMGAKLALLSKKHKDKAEEVKNKIKYIELSTRTDFQEIFVDCLAF